MTHPTDKYAQFVDHPRYGRRPNVTGLNPSPMDRGVHLHWNASTHSEIIARYESVTGKDWPFGDSVFYSSQTNRIPNTAIAADPARQTGATVPVTHYFDLKRQCRDCKRMFIFFAAEQKYWYEELGFGLESDCVRCAECRKHQQGLARQRETYEALFLVQDRSADQSLTMADACLSLIENGVFTTRQTERVRMLLNSIPKASDIRKHARYSGLVRRLLSVEAKCSQQSGGR